MQIHLQGHKMTEEKSNVVYIGDKSYNSEDLSKEQIKLFNKTLRYQNRVEELRDALEDATILHKDFSEKLKSSLANAETTKAMENSKVS